MPLIDISRQIINRSNVKITGYGSNQFEFEYLKELTRQTTGVTSGTVTSSAQVFNATGHGLTVGTLIRLVVGGAGDDQYNKHTTYGLDYPNFHTVSSTNFSDDAFSIEKDGAIVNGSITDITAGWITYAPSQQFRGESTDGSKTFSVDASTGDVYVGGDFVVQGLTSYLDGQTVTFADEVIGIGFNGSSGIIDQDNGVGGIEIGVSGYVEADRPRITYHATDDKWKFYASGQDAGKLANIDTLAASTVTADLFDGTTISGSLVGQLGTSAHRNPVYGTSASFTGDVVAASMNNTPIGGSTAAAGTFSTITLEETGNLIVSGTGGTVSINSIFDEDSMSSDSDTALATQQSIKAYVDASTDSADALTELTDVNMSTLVSGQSLFYDTDGGRWKNATISGDIGHEGGGSLGSLKFNSNAFTTELSNNKLNDLAAATSDYAMGGNTLTDLSSPSDPAHAATKAYVDSVAEGLDVKASVKFASTVNLTTLSGQQSIDGGTTSAGDRILLKDQDTASENGIYLASATDSDTLWTRAADFDDTDSVTGGAFTFVEQGTANADSGWVVVANSPITVGTSDIEFSQFSGAGMVTAGAGLTKSGNTINVVAGSGISVDYDDVRIGAGSINNSMLSTGTYGSIQGLATQVQDLSFGNNYRPSDLALPTDGGHATSRNYVLGLSPPNLATASGNLAMGSDGSENKIIWLANPTDAKDAANKEYVDTVASNANDFSEMGDTNIVNPSTGQVAIYDGSSSWDNVSIGGDATLASDGTLTLAANSVEPSNLAAGTYTTISGIGTQAQALNMNSNFITGLPAPGGSGYAVRQEYVDDADALLLPLAGGTLTGNLTLSGAPSNLLHAATKSYVDNQTAGGVGGTFASSLKKFQFDYDDSMTASGVAFSKDRSGGNSYIIKDDTSFYDTDSDGNASLTNGQKYGKDAYYDLYVNGMQVEPGALRMWEDTDDNKIYVAKLGATLDWDLHADDEVWVKGPFDSTS